MIVVWARYATAARADQAARTQRFGPGPWRIERRGSGPYPFALLWIPGEPRREDDYGKRSV